MYIFYFYSLSSSARRFHISCFSIFLFCYDACNYPAFYVEFGFFSVCEYARMDGPCLVFKGFHSMILDGDPNWVHDNRLCVHIWSVVRGWVICWINQRSGGAVSSFQEASHVNTPFNSCIGRGVYARRVAKISRKNLELNATATITYCLGKTLSRILMILLPF